MLAFELSERIAGNAEQQDGAAIECGVAGGGIDEDLFRNGRLGDLPRFET